MKTIGIIGGSGYIGGHLLQSLSSQYEVISLQRNKQAIMPARGIRIIQIDELTETFDIVINTSYNLGKSRADIFEQNKDVLQTIQKASHSNTKVIHLSSLAVFGFGLDKTINPGPVKTTHDYGYVESKAHMENLLLSAIPNSQLSIIRLGNVWGPANNSWTQPLADALQWSLPVVSNNHSFSNITFIHHITEYIDYLLSQSTHQLIHHLAEFSDISWQQIISEMSAHLNVEPQPISAIPFYASNLAHDLQHAAQLNPFVFLKRFRDGRFSSRYFPSKAFMLLQTIINKHMPKQDNLALSAYNPDPTFYWILSNNVEFKSITLPGWQPSYSWEKVKLEVNQWLDEAGFTVEKSA
jgi:nucleoside-diphosphate-sugar epimerase